MAKTKLLQIRVPAELKELLKNKGDMSAYVRGLIERDMGLTQKTVAGNPVAEPRPYDDPEKMKEVDADLQEFGAVELTALARRRWPHLPLAVAEKKVKAESDFLS